MIYIYIYLFFKHYSFLKDFDPYFLESSIFSSVGSIFNASRQFAMSFYHTSLGGAQRRCRRLHVYGIHGHPRGGCGLFTGLTGFTGLGSTGLGSGAGNGGE